MEDFEYVLEVIDPWINKYHEHGNEALSPEEMVGVGVWLLEAESTTADSTNITSTRLGNWRFRR